jgi:hypothetical protein
LKKKGLMLIAANLILVLALAISGCSQTTAPQAPVTTTAPPQVTITITPTPQIVEKDKSYNCMSPLGIAPSVDVKPLAARLDTLAGKVIYVNQGEADPIIMPALWTRVQKDYPNTTWKLIATSSFGPSSLEAEVTASAKAVIRGIAW